MHLPDNFWGLIVYWVLSLSHKQFLKKRSAITGQKIWVYMCTLLTCMSNTYFIIFYLRWVLNSLGHIWCKACASITIRFLRNKFYLDFTFIKLCWNTKIVYVQFYSSFEIAKMAENQAIKIITKNLNWLCLTVLPERLTKK